MVWCGVVWCSMPIGSRKLEYGFRVIYALFPSFFGLGTEDGHIPTLWLLLEDGVGVV